MHRSSYKSVAASLLLCCSEFVFLLLKFGCIFIIIILCFVCAYGTNMPDYNYFHYGQYFYTILEMEESLSRKIASFSPQTLKERTNGKQIGWHANKQHSKRKR